jgi:hypothetical protein
MSQFENSANFADPILPASNSKRLFEAGAVKIESPWHQLASFLVDNKQHLFVHI